MPDAMSPEEIENTRFTISVEGYDKDEVEVFLKGVAADFRSLQRQIPDSSDRPYYEAGREVGDLLQHAHDSALHIKKEAQEEAAVLLQDAQRTSKRAREEAALMTKRAEKEASVVREEAYAAAERYREQAERSRRLAEAERSIAGQDTRRETKRLRDEAKRQAQQILSRAQAEAAERTVESERRLRRLQEAEATMRRRAALLQSKLDELTEKVRAAQSRAAGEEERKTIYLDGPAEGARTNGTAPSESEYPPGRDPIEE
jgi:DivIVA domain-containing protein